MVNTVLARDKNWIWWKIQRCPSIVRDAVSAQNYEAAKEAVRQSTANKRIKTRPVGSMDLTFLAEAHHTCGLDSLKDARRYKLPSKDELVSQLATEELDLDFATDAEKEEIKARMDGISWRLVRTASRTALAKFDAFGHKPALMIKVLGPDKDRDGSGGSGVRSGGSSQGQISVADGKAPEVQAVDRRG